MPKKKANNDIELDSDFFLPEDNSFAVLAFQTANQRCYQFASYTNSLFNLNFSNVGSLELFDFYKTSQNSVLFYYKDERKGVVYQLVDISRNDKIKEFGGYDKLLVITGNNFERKANEIESQYDKIEGVMFVTQFRFDGELSRKEKEMRGYIASLLWLMEECRDNFLKKQEENKHLRETLG